MIVACVESFAVDSVWGVWLMDSNLGYIDIHDNLKFLEEGYFKTSIYSPKIAQPRPIKIMMGEDHLATTTALSRPRSFTTSLLLKFHHPFACHMHLVNSLLRSMRTPK